MEKYGRKGIPYMEERYALLIDAENVSAKYIKPILDELSKYGNVTYKRIYGLDKIAECELERSLASK